MILLDCPLNIRPRHSLKRTRTQWSTLCCVGDRSKNPVLREFSSLHFLWKTRTSHHLIPSQSDSSRNPIDEHCVILANAKHSSSSSCWDFRRLAGLTRSRMPDDMLPISRSILKMETHPRPFASPSTSPVKTCGWSANSFMQGGGFCFSVR